MLLKVWLVAVLLCPVFAFAQTTITSQASGNWASTSTWAGGVVPGINDNAIINHDVNVSTVVNVNSIQIQNTATNAARLQLTSGSNLTVTNNVTVSNTLNATDSQLYFSTGGVMTINGTLTFTNTHTQATSKLVRLLMLGVSYLTVKGDFIYNFNSTVTSESNFEVSLGSGSASSKGIVEVGGDLNLNMNTSSGNGTLHFIVANLSTLLVKGNLNFNNISGGSRNQLEVNQTASVTVNGNINMLFSDLTPNSGTSFLHQSNQIVLFETASLKVKDVNLTSYSSTTTGNLIRTVQFSNSTASSILVSGDIIFSSAAGNLENGININDVSSIEVKGKILNTSQGSFGFAGSGLMKLTGTGQQNLPATTAFKKVEINNTSGLPITVPVATTIGVDLNLINGVLETSGSSTITLDASCTVNEGNSSSYISGPVKKKFSTVNPDIVLPLGKGTRWAPLGLSNIAGADLTTVFSTEYFNSSYSTTSVANNIDEVSTTEYWNTQVTGTKPSLAIITINWKDACYSGISDVSSSDKICIANFYTSLSKWSRITSTIKSGSLACDAASAASETGAITTMVDSNCPYGPLTFGHGIGQPLPVVFLGVDVKSTPDEIILKWKTSEEINNDHFVVQRSSNGKDFHDIGQVEADDSEVLVHEYSYSDPNPLDGRNYYRIKQIDYDLTYMYSDIAVAVFSNHQETLTVYPNPVINASAFVKLNHQRTGSVLMSAVLMDTHGKLISSWKDLIKDETGVYLLDIADIRNGSYIIKVIADNKVYVKHLSINNSH